MACFSFPLSLALALWLGSISLGCALLLFAYSRAWILEKVGALGVEVKLEEPVRHPGRPRARLLAAIVGVAGLVLTGFGGFRTNVPVGFPTSFSQVCSAQIQLSRVDDSMEVKVNDRTVAKATYGQALEWVDILPSLKAGANKIEVQIDNGQYGGCGGMLVGRLNGIESPSFRWERQKTENQLPNVSCFYETFTLNL